MTDDQDIESRLRRVSPGVPADLRERLLSLQAEIALETPESSRRWMFPTLTAMACLILLGIAIPLSTANRRPEPTTSQLEPEGRHISRQRLSVSDSGVLMHVTEVESDNNDDPKSRRRRPVALTAF